MSNSNISQIITVQKNKVVQIVSNVLTTKQTTAITTAGTFYAITSPSVSLTATNASSRIILFITLSYSSGNSASHYYLQVLRDSTVIGGGSGGSTGNCSFGAMVGANSTNVTTTAIECDLPGDTSAHTYSLQVTSDNSAENFRLNRTNSDNNATTIGCATSSIVAMEVLP